MNLGLADKVAMVTGGARGIGKATTKALIGEGVKVAIVDIDQTAIDETLDELGSENALGVVADVVDFSSVEYAVAAVTAKWDSPDILVNNAGFPRDGFLTKISEGDWRRVVEVILFGAFNCSRATVGAMHRRGWGRIINISSRSHLGNPGQTNYSAAKAGLIGFTRALALESGGFGVTVNAIAPGFIETDAMLKLPNYDVLKQRSIDKSPLKRVGMPEEIADAVLFLASERAGFITGDLIHVTGGRYA
jgi:3-oxoacyl-[acyl-carrier protein] reductase